MYEYKKCDNCNRMLKNSDKVTVIIPDVEVEGRYRKDQEGFRLKLSRDGIEINEIINNRKNRDIFVFILVIVNI